MPELKVRLKDSNEIVDMKDIKKGDIFHIILPEKYQEAIKPKDICYALSDAYEKDGYWTVDMDEDRCHRCGKEYKGFSYCSECIVDMTLEGEIGNFIKENTNEMEN